MQCKYSQGLVDIYGKVLLDASADEITAILEKNEKQLTLVTGPLVAGQLLL